MRSTKTASKLQLLKPATTACGSLKGTAQRAACLVGLRLKIIIPADIPEREYPEIQKPLSVIFQR
jgi:hypothetical protein